MKTRAELKGEIKQLFRGRWKDAVLLCIVVSLLSVFSIIVQASDNARDTSTTSPQDFTGGLSVVSTIHRLSGADFAIVGGIIFGFLLVQIVFGLIVKLFKIGTSYSMLDWVRNPEREIHPVADSTVGFTKTYAWPLVGLVIYRGILIFLWSLLLIVPGIIKAYAYSQAFYVYKDMLAATPAGQAKPRFRDAITRSRQLMRHHKFEYFVLQLSFIGWGILSGITLGIGQLWLIPYSYGTYANYYDDLTTMPATN